MSGYLELLRDEHRKLQQQYNELQKRYDVLLTSENRCDNENHCFVQKLVQKIADVYNRNLYSDVTIHCDGHQLRAHRLILTTHTDYWDDMTSSEQVELRGVSYNVAYMILKWMYTDQLDEQLGDKFLMEIFSTAHEYRLNHLMKRCEQLFLPRIDIDNCLMFYEFAILNDLRVLETGCNEFFKDHWHEITKENFLHLSASLVYRMLKSSCSHSSQILHSIIKSRRTDVLFLFFIDYSLQLNELCNQPNELGQLPIESALEYNCFEIATSLVEHGADLSATDKFGVPLLAKIIEKNNSSACEFLLSNGARLNDAFGNSHKTIAHVIAQTNCSQELLNVIAPHIGNLQVCSIDSDNKTALLCAVECENIRTIELLLRAADIGIDRCDRLGNTPLSCALLNKKNLFMAELLVKSGANLDIYLNDDERIIHIAVRTQNVQAVHFLCKNKVDLQQSSSMGVPLQIACDTDPPNFDIVRMLLRGGAKPSQKTVDGDTILHAILDNGYGEQLLNIFIDEGLCDDEVLACVNESNQTAFVHALLSDRTNMAKLLLQAGSQKEVDENGLLLLRQTIDAKMDAAAVFVIEHGLKNIMSEQNDGTLLALAIKNVLPETVKRMCSENLNGAIEVNGPSFLWMALEIGNMNIANILIASGCDMNAWCYNIEKQCHQTLLHKAIDLGMTDAALFLIENGCNINSSEKYGVDKKAGATPLYLAIKHSLNSIAIRLVEQQANLDQQDDHGQTLLHLAVIENNAEILNELLKVCNSALINVVDSAGNTPLASAIERKNFNCAEALIKKAPELLEKGDKNGETSLQHVVRNSDLEAVLFLITVGVDVNMHSHNSEHTSALHLCAHVGSEMIMRNLILAGADVNAVSANGLTALHIAAYKNHEIQCVILLENGASPNATDKLGNTPLHAAVLSGSVASVNVLVADSRMNLKALNKKQQTPLFLTGYDHSGTTSLDILHIFLNADSQYPLDDRDQKGNTLFLLSFINGNNSLCKELLHHGVCLSVINGAGVSVFKHATPTKQLLFTLLDNLEREPIWADGDFCSECESKFTITMRKHHCRHCGRLVCAHCSEHTIPILKYGIEKAVRVCQICCDVLTMGRV